MLINQRQRKTKNPCSRCALHLERCICAQIPKLDLKTKLSLIVHAKELKRTTNSGRLAIHALTNSEMVVRGQLNGPTEVAHLLTPEYETYLLFPAEDAVDLETVKPNKPVQLIVADGNWRQASKVNVRYPELKDVVRVKISRANEGVHHLRKEHFKEGFSTLEAIAIAFGILEGEHVGDALRALYHAKLNATLEGRGVLTQARVSSVYL